MFNLGVFLVHVRFMFDFGLSLFMFDVEPTVCMFYVSRLRLLEKVILSYYPYVYRVSSSFLASAHHTFFPID